MYTHTTRKLDDKQKTQGYKRTFRPKSVLIHKMTLILFKTQIAQYLTNEQFLNRGNMHKGAQESVLVVFNRDLCYNRPSY